MEDDKDNFRKECEATPVVVDPIGNDHETSAPTSNDDNVDFKNEQELPDASPAIVTGEQDNLPPQSEHLELSISPIDAIEHAIEAFRSLQESETGRSVSKLIGNLFVVATAVATYAGIKTLIDKTPEEAAQIVLQELRDRAGEITASNKMVSDKLRDSIEHVATELDRTKQEIIAKHKNGPKTEADIAGSAAPKQQSINVDRRSNSPGDGLTEKAISMFYESNYIGAWMFFSKFLPNGNCWRETSPPRAYLDDILSKQLDIARKHPP